MELHFKAINDRLIIRRSISDNKTSDGIILPDNKSNTVHRFQVVSVGETVDKYLPGMHVGDVVLADQRYATYLDQEYIDYEDVHIGTVYYYSIRCVDIISPVVDL